MWTVFGSNDTLIVTEITSLCAQHAVRPSGTKLELAQRKVYYRFIQADGGSCPKNRKVTESFQRGPLKAKGEGGREVGCCRLLCVRSFVPEVRWPGSDVPANLYQVNVILCPDKKARSQGTAFTLQGPSPGSEETGLSWQLPQGHEGARHPPTPGLRLLRLPRWGDQVPQTVTQTDGHC